MLRKYFYIILVILFLSSCKNNDRVIKEEIINLYPNKELIKKKYYRYSLFDPFSSNDSIYVPIEPRVDNPKMAKTLIKATEPYNTQTFKRYLVDKMGGQYSSYIVKNDTILYRYYFRHFKKNESKDFDTREKIENYFKKYNIEYKFIEYEDNLSIYLLMRKGNLPPSYCVIEADSPNLNVHITYNVEDTIKHLPSKSLIPFRGSKIEN